MITARDLIKTALRKIHVLGEGRTLSAEEARDGLMTLNAMLASWSAEGDLDFAAGDGATSLLHFARLDSVLILPPAYHAAIIFNLALWLAPDYEREASDTVKRLAAQSKGIIAIHNSRADPPLMAADAVPTTDKTRFHIMYG